MPQTREELLKKKKLYYQKNRESTLAKQKIWRENNKELKAKRDKLYYESNKEKWSGYDAVKSKNYNQSPEGKRRSIICDWKRRGVICSDYHLLYSNYLAETHCDFCRVKFGKYGDKTGTYKCLDHSHETGLFRNFLCHKCNIKRRE